MANTDPRSVARYLAGLPCRPSVVERIVRALVELDLGHIVPGPRKPATAPPPPPPLHYEEAEALCREGESIAAQLFAAWRRINAEACDAAERLDPAFAVLKRQEAELFRAQLAAKVAAERAREARDAALVRRLDGLAQQGAREVAMAARAVDRAAPVKAAKPRAPRRARAKARAKAAADPEPSPSPRRSAGRVRP